MQDGQPAGSGTKEPAEGWSADVPISRRHFTLLTAATGGALALPGRAVADLQSETMTEAFEYVVNHTPDEYAVPTLIRFADKSGIDDLLSLDIEIDDDWILTEPPVAYAQLTTAQTEEVIDIPTAEELSYTPGSNPFWRLGYYPLGVFPAPHRSVDFIDYEQMISGMEQLESEHSDMLKFYALSDTENPHDVDFGRSPGHHNRLTDRDDPKDLHIAEITKDIDQVRGTEEFEDRQKVMFVASIHGLERAGAEASYRFIERILTGRELGYEQLLDDVVLIIISANPDGWVAKSPQYDSGWQTGGPGASHPRIPAAPLHERGNAEIYDSNRQYPTVGWIDPAHHPGEPDEDRWAEDNPHDIINKVPDAMGTVEHFRQYRNLTHGADLHGMFWNSDFILGLINQIEYTQNEFHDLYEMNHVLEESLEEKMEDWETLAEVQEEATDDFNPQVLMPVLPETAYDYSTIWDTIGYTVTGGLIGFMGASPERGGLDVTTMAFEMAYTHLIGGNVYNPELCQKWTTGYIEAMKTMTDYAVRDVDSEVVTRDGEGETVAYVASDALTRSSDDLSFMDDDGGSEIDSSTHELIVDVEETETLTFDVADGLHTLSVHAHAPYGIADVLLRNPAGDVVRSYRPSEFNGDTHHHIPPLVVKEPPGGDWALEVVSWMTEEALEVHVTVGTLQSETEHPDPREALGFEQEEYEVSPLVFFDDFEAENKLVTTVGLTPDEVATEGVDADHLVVIHDDRGDDPDGYVAAIDDFVAQGGNLVLTDQAVHLLGDMASTAEISAVDITDDTFGVSRLEEKVEDHPLLVDTRPIQRMTWKVAPLGYPYANDAPMTLIAEEAFTAAGGTVAGETDGRISAGSIFTHDQDWRGIHVVAGLLPPASQQELHPFGLKNYVLAYFGFTILINALGMEQHRFVDGEQVRTIGDADKAPVEPAFLVSGDRDDSGSVFTGGQTNRTDLTIEVVSPPDEVVVVRDHVPPDWGVDEEFGDVEATTPAMSGGTWVYFGVDEPADAYEELTHFAEAPDGLADSDTYTFGPIEVTRDTDEDGTLTDREWSAIADTEREVTVLGAEI